MANKLKFESILNDCTINELVEHPEFDRHIKPGYDWEAFKNKYIAEHGSLGYEISKEPITDDLKRRFFMSQNICSVQRFHKFWMDFYKEVYKKGKLDKTVEELSDIQWQRYKSHSYMDRHINYDKLYDLKDEYELVPNKYWADIMTFWGYTRPVCDNNLLNITQDLVLEYYKPGSKNALLLNCANFKPYIYSRYFSRFYALSKKYNFDIFIIEENCIVPLEWSIYYPFRFVNWPHDLESVEDAEYMTYKALDRFEEVVKKCGYENVFYDLKPTRFNLDHIEGIKERTIQNDNLKNVNRMLSLDEIEKSDWIKDIIDVKFKGHLPIFCCRWYSMSSVQIKLIEQWLNKGK